MTNFRQTLLMIVIATGLAFLFSGFLNKAQSQTATPETRGPYMLAAGDRFMVWRIDQATGKVSYCQRDQAQSTDPKYVASRRPFCSGWSAE
jgi:hypothetical protein